MHYSIVEEWKEWDLDNSIEFGEDANLIKLLCKYCLLVHFNFKLNVLNVEIHSGFTALSLFKCLLVSVLACEFSCVACVPRSGTPQAHTWYMCSKSQCRLTAVIVDIQDILWCFSIFYFILHKNCISLPNPLCLICSLTIHAFGRVTVQLLVQGLEGLTPRCTKSCSGCEWFTLVQVRGPSPCVP